MASPSPSTSAPSITIIGGGIIGASIAYHLSLHSHPATVLEQDSPACAASGRAAGFLALDWCDDTPLHLLARPSFRLHAALATALPGTDYRRLSAYSASLASPQAAPTTRRKPAPTTTTRPPALSWLDGEACLVTRARRIGTEASVAQVHPRKLTHALLSAARAQVGTSVERARVEDVSWSEGAGRWVVSARVGEGEGAVTQSETDVVVLAMGPWTSTAQRWFPRLPAVVPRKAASVVVGARVPGTAVFTEFVDARGGVKEPEVYPRADEVYLCQSAVQEELPAEPSRVAVAESDVRELVEFGKALSTAVAEAVEAGKVTAQACYLPVGPDGLPIIGEVPGARGRAFVAAGHSVWGILNGPATGKAVADLIVTGGSSIDLAPFAPDRFG